MPWTDTFTGTAWADLLLRQRADDAHDLTLTTVTFDPTVRTHWHHHAGGQLLLVTAGEGWVATRQDGRVTVQAGDVIWTPSGEDHWHGATDATSLTHVAVTLGATAWLDEPPLTA